MTDRRRARASHVPEPLPPPDTVEAFPGARAWAPPRVSRLLVLPPLRYTWVPGSVGGTPASLSSPDQDDSGRSNLVVRAEPHKIDSARNPGSSGARSIPSNNSRSGGHLRVHKGLHRP